MEENEQPLHQTERERNTKLKRTKKLREEEKKPKILTGDNVSKDVYFCLLDCLLASSITTPAQVVFAETNKSVEEDQRIERIATKTTTRTTIATRSWMKTKNLYTKQKRREERGRPKKKKKKLTGNNNVSEDVFLFCLFICRLLLLLLLLLSCNSCKQTKKKWRKIEGRRRAEERENRGSNGREQQQQQQREKGRAFCSCACVR
jgi:hypothetical protein